MILVRTLALVAAVSLALAAVRAQAAELSSPVRGETAGLQERPEVDDNESTRVEVQLVVLGVAGLTVVGAGLAGHLVRKRLGLVAGPPDQTQDGHH